jgi:uncharacterized Zn finger protein
MLDEIWENFFKPEVRASGRRLVDQEKVSISSGTDTDVQAFVRNVPSIRVRLSAENISSESFTARCSCPSAKKGQFCKHVWAVLLCAGERYPDFLSAKRMIEKPDPLWDGPPESEDPSRTAARARAEQQRREMSEKQKARAADYRKEQYRKQKERVKAQKGGRNARVAASFERNVFSPEVEGALAYFSENGFPMPAGPDEEILSEAKRKLSRVFHPDKGGSHQEIVELNRNWELLLRLL